MQHPPISALRTLMLCAMACAAAIAHAQGVYRIVGPDGKVTYSDRAPLDTPQIATGSGPAAANAALPVQLREVTAKFPVTLYTGNDCAPCAAARNLLVARGVPFTERTVTTNEDIDALQRISGNASLPFATIGGQKLAGFSTTEYTQYLDAAGYPAQSQLPNNYRRAPAAPLVAVKPAEAAPPTRAAAPTSRASARPTPPPVVDGPSPSNPAGIRF